MRFRYPPGMSARYTYILVVVALWAAAMPAMAHDTLQGDVDELFASDEGLPTGHVPVAATSGSTLLADDEIYPLVFPVVGENHYTDTWGAARSSGRTHQGVDIIADKMVPVVAAASGTVGWIHDEQGGNCCAMALNHDDGWASWYIHLNNDTPGTDDGLGWGFAEGIESGAHVEAGQLIGWVGDSGNAEATVSHLHFELHQPDGTPINPYPHVVEAAVIAEPGDAPPPGDSGSEEGQVSVSFSDVSGSVHSENILQLAELGITGGCAPELYCPEDPVTRAQMATFLTRALGLPIPDADTFSDDDGSTHEPNIEALAAAEITLGCGDGSYCPNDEVTRAQMATFLTRALGLASVDADSFDDDDGSTHEPNIEALAAAEVTLGCGDRAYCPGDSVTRAQMATFLIRALDAGLASRPEGRLVPAEGVLTGVFSDGDIVGYETAVGREMDLTPLTFEGVVDIDAMRFRRRRRAHPAGDVDPRHRGGCADGQSGRVHRHGGRGPRCIRRSGVLAVLAWSGHRGGISGRRGRYLVSSAVHFRYGRRHQRRLGVDARGSRRRRPSGRGRLGRHLRLRRRLRGWHHHDLCHRWVHGDGRQRSGTTR